MTSNKTSTTHIQMQSNPLAATRNTLISATHELKRTGRKVKKTGARTNPYASTTQATQMQRVTHTQTQTKPRTTTCNKSILARHEIPQKDAWRKKVGTTTTQRQAQHTSHKCSMSRIPQRRPNRSQQPATK